MCERLVASRAEPDATAQESRGELDEGIHVRRMQEQPPMARQLVPIPV